jgi:methylenetetrahydrofolate dehydrogenase (NADP+) / methenyltetrahydrofolate cyclohydrolase
MGKPAFVTGDFIKPGATVIDVGINRLSDRSDVERIFGASSAKLADFDKKGSILIGDVHPVDVAAKSGAYTPVPGGVGLLTVAMLMVNTIDSAERRIG